MLSKDICRRCKNKNHLYKRWNQYDEIRWKEGIINCSIKHPKIRYVVESIYKLYEECPYMLEHLIKEQKYVR